jgi:hypothetical protein
MWAYSLSGRVTVTLDAFSMSARMPISRCLASLIFLLLFIEGTVKSELSAVGDVDQMLQRVQGKEVDCCKVANKRRLVDHITSQRQI